MGRLMKRGSFNPEKLMSEGKAVISTFGLLSCLQSCFLGSATFAVSDLLRAKDERLTLSLK